MKKSTGKLNEPFIRIVKRDGFGQVSAWAIRISAILLSLVASAVLIYALTKLNPVEVYVSMFKGAFKNSKIAWRTIRDAVLLLCLGVGLAPAFKMRFWNIGAEGQMLVGGIATAACLIYFKDLPTAWLIIVAAAASIFAGALWGFLPTLFKAYFGTNETLFTLMMNYVAIQLTAYFVSVWENPKGSNYVKPINSATQAGWFPELFGKEFMLNVIIVLAITLFMFFYLKKTKHGYEIAVVGESENTARYAGINVKKVLIRTMLLSGAICGIAGFIKVCGADHTISTTTAGGRGFTAIIVAWMAKFNPVVMIIVSLLITFLNKGAGQIASDFDLNEHISDMITGIILFFVLGCEFFINYRLVFRKMKNGKEGK